MISRFLSDFDWFFLLMFFIIIEIDWDATDMCKMVKSIQHSMWLILKDIDPFTHTTQLKFIREVVKLGEH